VEERRFRQDLYYRISTLEMTVPALRDRREDIPLLADGILDRLARDLGQKRVTIGPDAERILRRYDWPGNIRELRNVLERALLRNHSDVLDAEAIVMPSEPPTSPSAAAPPSSTRGGTLEDIERSYMEQVLREEAGAIDRVAGRLGISRSAVYYKARKHNIEIAKSRS
jgi:DNA-binding NtrC family response regulator